AGNARRLWRYLICRRASAPPAWPAMAAFLRRRKRIRALGRCWNMTVETLDRVEFEAIRPQWGRLLEASDSDCLFLSWEWLHTWWKHLAHRRKLYLLTVRQASHLVAIPPLLVRPSHL